MDERPAQPERPARRLRWTPLIVAILLAAATTSARQWQNLVTGLSQVSDTGSYRFAPSGNEWRLRTWRAFGVRRYELRRTFTRTGTADSAADARGAFARLDLTPGINLAEPPAMSNGVVEWSSLAWGWPVPHTALDARGRRRILPGGFALDTLAFTPVWYLALHLLRAPVAAVMNRIRRAPWQCRQCRYDLRGLPEDAPCPECGRKQVDTTA